MTGSSDHHLCIQMTKHMHQYKYKFLPTFTKPTIYDVRQKSRPPSKITTHNGVSLNEFFGQPDDGLYTGPKHYYCSYLHVTVVIIYATVVYGGPRWHSG